MLIALLLPALQAAREAARRAQCVNNLKPIALGMHNYHETMGSLPPGIKGCCQGTWLIYVLPFVEQSALFNSWNALARNSPNGNPSDVDFGYSGAVNTNVTRIHVAAYKCPTDPNGWAVTNAGDMITSARSRHPGGVDAALADGSVKFFKNSVSLPVWRSFSTSRGGEIIGVDWY